MPQIIRILAIVIRVGRSHLRYKIAYRRIDYTGYDLNTGDILDSKIWDFFNAKRPIQIFWEVIQYDTGQDFSNILNGFLPKQIPLIINASINTSSMTDIELDNLKNSNMTFPDQIRTVTLFYRANMNEQHEDWVQLPMEIRISMDYKIYIQLSKTILPF